MHCKRAQHIGSLAAKDLRDGKGEPTANDRDNVCNRTAGLSALLYFMNFHNALKTVSKVVCIYPFEHIREG